MHLLSGRMQCADCGSEYPAEDNFVSLVSREATPLDPGLVYTPRYLASRDESSDIAGWRIPRGVPLKRKRRQVEAVKQLLLDADTQGLICDFSAGPGYYTLAYARHWRWVMHCDLLHSSLMGAREQARRQGLQNILFVRMDYLRPPFQGTLPRIICMDSLVRGEQHELKLLHAILGSLTPDGNAVVDFHNWWHNPIRRLGLLRENFVPNGSYSRRQLSRLLSQAGITEYERIPFHQEAEPGSLLAALICRTVPPTRWMFRIRHAAEPHSRPA